MSNWESQSEAESAANGDESRRFKKEAKRRRLRKIPCMLVVTVPEPFLLAYCVLIVFSSAGATGTERSCVAKGSTATKAQAAVRKAERLGLGYCSRTKYAKVDCKHCTI